MEAKRCINVTREQREFLKKAFKVSGAMVSYALNFNERKGQTELARRIRSLALQKGGYVLSTLPESEVIHDSDGYMRQHYANGWMWECDKHNNVLTVVDGCGNAVEKLENVTVSDIEAVQTRLAAM